MHSVVSKSLCVGEEADAPGAKEPGKVLSVATVYTHLAAFHVPFMRLFGGTTYMLLRRRAREEGVEATGGTCWGIPVVQSLLSRHKGPACLEPRQPRCARRYASRSCILHRGLRRPNWLL